MSNPIRSAAVVGVMLMVAAAWSATAARADEGYGLSAPRIKHVAATEHFLCGQARTRLAEFGAGLQVAFGPAERAVDARRVQKTGPAVFIYDGATGDPQRPFTLTAGFPVAPGDEAPDGLSLKTLPERRVATAYFTGRPDQIPEAWEVFVEGVHDAGHTFKPGGLSYEVYLDWKGDASPNNVVELQIEVASEDES
ncbi:MAG: GyrI-like domain-containing protein [Planctomycetota bacterium]